MKVLEFLPQNITEKPAEYLLCGIWAGLVRHSQAQKRLHINHKPFHRVDMEF